MLFRLVSRFALYHACVICWCPVKVVGCREVLIRGVHLLCTSAKEPLPAMSAKSRVMLISDLIENHVHLSERLSFQNIFDIDFFGGLRGRSRSPTMNLRGAH